MAETEKLSFEAEPEMSIIDKVALMNGEAYAFDASEGKNQNEDTICDTAIEEKKKLDRENSFLVDWENAAAYNQGVFLYIGCLLYTSRCV